NWGNRNINVNRPVNINNIGNNWQHNPQHRQGVRYNNANVQQRFGNNNIRGGSNQRMDFRGRGGNQVLRPGGGDRANLGDRGNRPGAGDRGNRPGAGDRGRGQGNRVSTRPSGGGNRAGRGGGGGGRNNAFGNVGSGRSANLASQRGRASMGGGGFSR